VSIHGFAYNLTVDPADYRWIVPCGITVDQGHVASIRTLVGHAPEPAEVAPGLGQWLATRLDRTSR
jgi:lipoate-protein ligase B